INVECEDLYQIVYYINNILTYIRYLAPIAVILWGSIDLARAAMSGDQKQIEEYKQTFFKRLWLAAGIFLVSIVVQLVVQAFGGTVLTPTK
ncbi:MAG TPA: hypothetical protein GX690_03045, partial [Tenericutes bacterium]|nr:hypothetical protein [Mycoplasmatota bacterium]